ncbi:hypothetical protein [Mucilaginibacter sp. UR6-11]|uniref:hypothetical protein n=1 Tax=Mucilaginibacter sp. UR6-11 TaxID=1435644 RepID=UPI001E49DDAF|nr:hypothetical protein [Mucilaginibacter sp. UR6-11]MCC8427255.1 hypothetical protein [Mucilaginibacter sp. UR6-11]
MKKIYTTLVAIFAIFHFSYAQWNSVTVGIAYNAGGYVGIGTTNPGSSLEILEASDSKPNNIAAPTKSVLKFSRAGTPNYSYPESAEFRIGHGGPNVWGSKLDLFLNGAANITNVPDQNVMTWLYNGNVGIGTTSPNAKLAVKGTIHSQEVIVDMKVLPDYVFKPTYHLSTLLEVKTYVDQNHHLPEMPSAEQVAKDGLSLGDMNAKLLKKVEELTLYLIEENKKNENQQAQINELKQQVIALTNLKN